LSFIPAGFGGGGSSGGVGSGMSMDGTEVDSGESNAGVLALNTAVGALDGALFTLPSLFEYYVITAVAPNMNASAGNYRVGACMADGEPFSSTYPFQLIALSEEFAVANGAQKRLVTYSKLVKKASVVFAFAQFDTATTPKWNYVNTGSHSHRMTWTNTAYGVMPVEGEFLTVAIGAFQPRISIFYQGIILAPTDITALNLL